MVDDEGKPSAMNVSELIESFRTDPRNASLVMGTKANGPGSSSTNSSDVSGKKFSDYTGEQLVKIKKEDPSEYDRLVKTKTQ